MSSKNLGSESEVLDLEKGEGPADPETASASALARVERAAAAAELENEEEDAEVVTDPRKAGVVNLAVVVFCVAAIAGFVYNVYSMSKVAVPLREAFAYYAVYLILCVAPICIVLKARKPLVSLFAEVRPDAAATTSTARPVVATTSTARPGATTTSTPIKLLFLELP